MRGPQGRGLEREGPYVTDEMYENGEDIAEGYMKHGVLMSDPHP